MDDVFKALEYTVVQIGLHKVWRWSLVYASQARCLEETPELRDVTRHLLVESRPIRGGIWVGAQTVIEVIGSPAGYTREDRRLYRSAGSKD